MQPLESSSSSSRVVLCLLDDSNILQIPNKYYFMMRTTLAEYSKGRRKYNENKYKWLEQIKNKQIVDKLTFLPIEFIHDREIILNAVIHESLSESMFKISDKDLLLQAVRANSHAIRFASRNLFTDREVVIQAVKQNINVLNHIPNEYRNDKNFVLDVLLTHCTEPSNINNILYFLSQQLKSDKEVVVLAVKQNGASLGCASQELRKDKQVVLQAVQQNGLALQFASLMLKDDKEVVMAAVQQNGHALQHASFTLKLDREVVQSAVRQNGASLAHALFDMTDDKDIVIEAIKQNRNAFPHASPRLKNHSEILTLVGESCSDTIEFLLLKHQSAFGALSLDNVPYPFRNDKQFILRALKNKALVAWEGIPVEIRNDREFALEAIKIDGKYINYLHAFKEDPEIIMQAYQHNNSVISHFPKKIGNDREFIMKYAGVLGRDVFVLNNYMLQDKEVLFSCNEKTHRCLANG
ncbi:hypothetical protein C9374_010019 [Naegleria lovaniensis]|uniref:DUF4116 domain-containing protein n=1 Tax=Naegleria lovaniensis TaxID=51637 RepID=A0AA88KH07_NAELO|nr:uncharacterized protein C9374_010019 [Naegleria lovaniensis]KAG2375396.1 hypothetical protein C9374_010019 [Naegleria lovaniensis]